VVNKLHLNFFKEKKMKKLIALVAALVMVSSFAYAADWNFYGSSRVSTFWTTVDANTSGTADVDAYAQALQGNSRIGANVKVSDELTGRFEYGTGVNVRLLYGEWNFGGGKLLVGQTYSPLNLFYSNQVFGADTDLLPYGGVYSGREPMLQLTFGDFKVAVVAPGTSAITVGVADGSVGWDKDNDGDYDATDAALAASAATGWDQVINIDTDDYDSIETSLPGIEVSYSFNLNPVALKVAAGYQKYELSNGTNTIDVDSYVIALGGKVNLGMAYLAADYYFGQNPGNMIWIDYNGGTSVDGLATVTGTTVNDNEVTGYLLVAGAKINDMFAVEAGYSTVSADLDRSTTDDDASAYYLQATITLAPGVSITPEYGVIDYEENGQNETIYVGVKWQINF
jgi:hypothetical protein